MAQDIGLRSRDMGIPVSHREGSGKGGWLLIDFTGVVIHLFTRDQRQRYSLEKLWSRAIEVVRLQ